MGEEASSVTFYLHSQQIRILCEAVRLPYRRHPNGSGKLYGDKADCSQDTFADRDCRIEANSSIGSSAISASLIRESIIYHALITDSVLSGCTIRGSIEGSTLHRPALRRVILEGVHVEGNVYLEGPWKMCADGVPLFCIRSGVWTRPPRHKILSHESGIHVGLTESTDGKCFIACNERPVTEWLQFGRKIGRKMGWPADLIEVAHRFMEELYEINHDSTEEVAA